MIRKKFFIPLFTLILILFNFNICLGTSTSSTSDLEITSEAAILVDNHSQKVLYSKNSDKKMYPASTTKIMTAILTLENCNLNDVVIASDVAVTSIPEGYSSANIQVEEHLTVEQLLQLLLIHSANDAANVLAQYVGGSIESFVSMMNTKAHELNLINTHFTNAYGKHDENHYTTAADLATLMQFCIKNDDFRKIAGSASCSIPSTNKSSARSYSNTNQLLIPENQYYYKYLTAGKTGFTSQAKECLVSCAYKDNLELTCVILGADDTEDGQSAKFVETKLLYEYGFKNFAIQKILSKDTVATQIEISNATKETKNLDLLISDDISTLLKNDTSLDEIQPTITLNEDISAPIQEGDILGTISYTIDDVTYSTNLIASHSVEKTKIVAKSFIFIVIACLIIFIIYKLNFSKRKKRKSKLY